MKSVSGTSPATVHRHDPWLSWHNVRARRRWGKGKQAGGRQVELAFGSTAALFLCQCPIWLKTCSFPSSIILLHHFFFFSWLAFWVGCGIQSSQWLAWECWRHVGQLKPFWMMRQHERIAEVCHDLCLGRKIVDHTALWSMPIGL